MRRRIKSFAHKRQLRYALYPAHNSIPWSRILNDRIDRMFRKVQSKVLSTTISGKFGNRNAFNYFSIRSKGDNNDKKVTIKIKKWQSWHKKVTILAKKWQSWRKSDNLGEKVTFLAKKWHFWRFRPPARHGDDYRQFCHFFGIAEIHI